MPVTSTLAQHLSSPIGTLRRCAGTIVLLAAALCTVQCAHASTLNVQVAELRQSQVQMDAFALSLHESSGSRDLALHAERFAIAVLDLGGVLDWRCTLEPDAQGNWSCTGPLILQQVRTAKLDATLHVTLQADVVEMNITHGKFAARVQIPVGIAAARVQVEAKRLPVTWLSRWVHNYWADGKLTAGMLEVKAGITEKTGIDARYTLSGLGFDSRDGSIAGDGLALDGSFRMHGSGSGLRIEVAGNLRGGEALFGPVYAKWPKSPVQFAIDAQPDGPAWKISRFAWKDPDVVELQARGSVDTRAAVSWQFDIDVQQARLPAVLDRYAASWLSTQGLKDPRTAGALSGAVALGDAGLTKLDLKLDNVSASDGAGRFGISVLNGAINWSATGRRPPTTLAWREAEFYRVRIDPATFSMQSQDGRIALTNTARLGTLGGSLELNALSFRPLAGQGERFGIGVALVDIDLARVSKAFGWPEFAGMLGGAIPHVSYDGSTLDLDGGLSLDAFGGSVAVTRMSLERPFGVAPSLAADIAISNIDLQQLTRVFSFGEISGRLDGHISNLRLIDWKPTAFAAGFRSRKGGRISQSAIDSLSSVGGSGIGGMQGAALKLFDSFRYSRLGIDCRLADNVCHMGGIGRASGNGYTIVEGSGLPHITVVGFQHEVDWPTLVTRLVAATRGDGPEIR